MSSQINPLDVNELFPVAGVDNSSEGFRTNFSAIKNNFTITKREMDDLINKVVVKAPLTYGNANAVNNNFNSEVISNAVLMSISDSYNNTGVQNTSGNVTVDFLLGNYHRITLSGSGTATVVQIINLPSTATHIELHLQVIVTDITNTLSFDGTYFLGKEVVGITQTANTIKFSSIGTYEFVVSRYTTGANVFITEPSSREVHSSVSYLQNNSVTTNSSLSSTGLTFIAQGNVHYGFSAILPIIHDSNSATQTISVSFDAGNCTAVVEQQAGPNTAFSAGTITTTNATTANVTVSGAGTARFAKVKGTFFHSTVANIAISFSTSAGNLTILSGGYLKFERLN